MASPALAPRGTVPPIAIRPVFIVGAPRSGTSLLFRTLQAHPSFAAMALDLSESRVLEALVRGDAPASMTDARRFFLGGAEPFEAFAKLAEPLHRRLSKGGRILSGLAKHSPALWGKLGGREALRAFCRYACAARGCRRLVEKTPTSLPFTRHLLGNLPHASAIAVLRHPVDTYASYRKRFAREGGEAAWADISVERFAAEWIADVQRARAAESLFGDRFLIVPYEAMVAFPEPTFAELLGRLGERWDPAVLRVPKEASRGATSKGDPHLYGAIVAQTKDWREHVPEDDAHRLEALTARGMASIGYSPKA